MRPVGLLRRKQTRERFASQLFLHRLMMNVVERSNVQCDFGACSDFVESSAKPHQRKKFIKSSLQHLWCFFKSRMMRKEPKSTKRTLLPYLALLHFWKWRPTLNKFYCPQILQKFSKFNKTFPNCRKKRGHTTFAQKHFKIWKTYMFYHINKQHQIKGRINITIEENWGKINKLMKKRKQLFRDHKHNIIPFSGKNEIKSSSCTERNYVLNYAAKCYFIFSRDHFFRLFVALYHSYICHLSSHIVCVWVKGWSQHHTICLDKRRMKT